jgi:hypothetical protein
MAKIASINSENGNTFTVAINQFADVTPAEFKKMLGYRKTHLFSQANV